MASIKILVAEDSTLVRQLLHHQLALQKDFEVVGEAKNGREAVDLIPTLRPDVVVMDLDMPIVNGAQATERITSQHPHVKVVLLTAHEQLTSIGRTSGASAILTKGTTPQELFEKIRQAHASRGSRNTESSSTVDHRAVIEILAVRSGLTDLERDVLESIVGADLTIDQIAAAFSAELKKTVTSSSIKHTLGRVMTKLRVEPRTRAALIKQVLEYAQNGR